MKKTQRNSFKLNPIAASIVLAMASQFAPTAVQAGAGWGLNTKISNPAVSVPVQAFYANSPAGSVPKLDSSGNPVTQTVTDPVTGTTTVLPVMVDSGKALRKFVDTLPGIPGVTTFGTTGGVNNLGQYIPVAVPQKWVDTNGNTTGDDYYEIAAVEFSEKMHSDLPKATHLRGYVQLSTATNPGKHIALTYPDGSPILDANGAQVYAYDNPHHLGPFINATSGTAVRVKFTNYLPVGGQLFLPVDTTITGAGLGPDGTTYYTQNRAEIHLVGGQAPWVSAGSPHQWVAPAGETNAYAKGLGKGVSNKDVPDMNASGAGSTTLYFPNAQSARFMFYQDRTSGLTRLNNYAGLEAGYMVTDATEAGLITSGAIPADQIPLIIEDKTFVPANVGQQDANWDTTNWGQPGDLWFPHVYEPNQDPTAVSATNSVGRWDYGPWFWPIFTASGPLPAVSFVPEAYEDTPLVNGTAYPTITVDPKAYRLRILNASNDRFLNLGLYKADTTVSAPQLDRNGNPLFDASGNPLVFTNTEVKMVPAVADVSGAPLTPPVGAATTTGISSVGYPLYDPACLCQYPGFQQLLNYAFSGPTRAWPVDNRIGGTPDPTAVGPDFIAIGTDGGFLPNPVDIPSQPITYESNRRSVTVTNVYGYGLLVGPSERTDVLVDFTLYANQTLIVYNDAPTPFPFDDQRWDYFSGDPDLTSTGGTYQTKPGYGPNTRTIMQIKVNATNTSGTGGALNPTLLASALPAAYKASQPAPIVPQSAYNSAFGTNDTDNYAHVATGSLAQPTFDFTQSGNNQSVVGINLISSGGQLVTGTTNIVGNANPGSGTGYDPLNPPTVVFNNGNCLPSTGTSATATATVDPTSHQVTALAFTSGAGYTCAPQITFTSAVGVGAQASPIMSSGTSSILAQTKTEQELFDALGRYNSTGGVELPLTTDQTQTTIPLNYTDSPTDFIKEGEVQIWKLVDNGFWSNSMHFDMVDVQLINRVGWDGTVKAPANNEVGWKDTLRLNPLEDVVVAMRAKTPPVPFGQPASIRAQDPSLAVGATNRLNQLAFTADPNVLAPVPSATSPSGYDLVATGLGSGAALLTTAVNTDIVVNNATGVLPANNTLAAGNLGYDNEFIWGTALLGHSEDDYQRPVVFHPTVTAPAAPSGLAGSGGKLSWVDATPAATSLGNPANEVGFQVLKAPITGNTVGAYASIATLPANTTGYTDAAASAASSYEVVAFNNAGTATSTPWVEISAPAVPTGLAALVNPTGTVRLTWNKVTGATSYVISSNGAAVTTVAAAGGGGTTQNTTITLPLGVNYTNITIASQLVFTGVTPSVTATSAASAPVSANLSAPAAPAAPTGLGVVYTAQATTATLNWTDSVTAGVTGYVVQQSINGGAWTQVGNVLGATAKTVNVTVANGNTYQYQVFAQSYLYAATNFTNSAAAGPVSLVTTPALPATVTNVAAAAASTSSINVSWTASATAGVTYVVQRKTGNGNFATITAVTSTAGTTISFTDKGLTAGSTYQYQVQAVATNTAGSTSSAFVASTSVSLAAPRVPTFAASTTVTTTGFTANWTAPTGTPAAASYLVSVNGAAAVSQTTTSIAVSGLTAGSTNTVTVAACSTGGVLCSTTASLTQATLPAAPAAPTASALAATTLTLTWTPVTGATSYTVQRATNAAFTTGVATAAGTFTGASLAVTGLTANTTYYFRVTAVNAGGSSAAGTVSAATLTAPAVPTGVTAANGTTGGAITGGLNFTVVTGLTYKLNSTGIAGGSAAVTTSGQQVTFATGGNNQVTLTATNASGSATSAAVTVNAR